MRAVRVSAGCGGACSDFDAEGESICARRLRCAARRSATCSRRASGPGGGTSDGRLAGDCGAGRDLPAASAGAASNIVSSSAEPILLKPKTHFRDNRLIVDPDTAIRDCYTLKEWCV